MNETDRRIDGTETADRATLSPDQIVWLQIDDSIGYWITVEQFMAVARSQRDYGLVA